MPKHAFSLTKLNFILIVFSLILFGALLLFMLYFGLGAIQETWHRRQIESLHSTVKERLLTLQQYYPDFSAEQVELALSDLNHDPTYLFVADGKGRILYSFRKTDRGVGRSRGLLIGMQDIARWETVMSAQGEVMFRYNTHLPSFVEVEANALLLSASRQLLVWALVASLLIASLVAYLVLLPLKRQSRHLAQALGRMAQGDRSVALSKQSVEEFDTIAQASLVLQQTLEHEEQLRSRWAMDIAHDLRTPLTVLKGQLEAIKDGVFTPDASRLDLLLKETQRLEFLINSLSLLTKLESPDFEVQKTEISLLMVLDTLKKRFEAEAQKRGMRIDITCENVMLLADSQLFSRALDNLLSNAIHYGKADKAIHITVLVDDHKEPLQCTIENEGLIDPEFLPFAFDRLSRAESARSEEGSGLGLSIVKAIVNAHGWKITVTSEKTTKFTLHFT